MDENARKQALGQLIKKERINKGFTQDSFSSLINIDARNLSKIERGESFPSFKTFYKIVEVLEIEPNYFFDFLKYKKAECEKEDIELFEIIKKLPKEIKIKTIELLKLMNKAK